jgi:hypothetical protein
MADDLAKAAIFLASDDTIAATSMASNSLSMAASRNIDSRAGRHLAR